MNIKSSINNDNDFENIKKSTIDFFHDNSTNMLSIAVLTLGVVYEAAGIHELATGKSLFDLLCEFQINLPDILTGAVHKLDALPGFLKGTIGGCFVTTGILGLAINRSERLNHKKDADCKP